LLFFVSILVRIGEQQELPGGILNVSAVTVVIARVIIPLLIY
jgi:hypothetical protein